MNDRLLQSDLAHLPMRPRLLPGLQVFERDDGDLQIGLDPQHGVVASGLPRDLAETLRQLDGTRRLDSLLHHPDPKITEQLKSVLNQLLKLGLLEDAGPPARQRRPTIEAGLWSLRAKQRNREITQRRAYSAAIVRGNGRLTVAIASHLATAGVGHVQVETSGRVTEADLGSGYTETDLGTTRSSAAVKAIHRANSSTKTGRLPENRRPELVILTDSVVPAPEVVLALVQEGIPHLAVRVRDGLGIVGPLVLPGRTSCLRCADLHRTALDSSWPLIAGQLAGRTQQADLPAITATAAIAAGQILRILSTESTPPPIWNATIEIDTFQGTLEQRPWTPHPACDCGTSSLLNTDLS